MGDRALTNSPRSAPISWPAPHAGLTANRLTAQPNNVPYADRWPGHRAERDPMQRVALQFWHLGAAKKKADREVQEEARRRLHEKLFPSDSAAVLESDG
jgi:hypothetical protein